MRKYTLYIVSIISIISYTGCSDQKIKQQSKAHSQYIMEHICSDTIYKEFSNKHFNPDRLKEIVQEFCESCPDYKQHGGFKNFQYHVFTSSENHIIYIYEYQCQSTIANVKFHYALYKDQFELLGFKVEYTITK